MIKIILLIIWLFGFPIAIAVERYISLKGSEIKQKLLPDKKYVDVSENVKGLAALCEIVVMVGVCYLILVSKI